MIDRRAFLSTVRAGIAAAPLVSDAKQFSIACPSTSRE